jgi:hypothetical protein
MRGAQNARSPNARARTGVYDRLSLLAALKRLAALKPEILQNKTNINK